MMPALSGRGPNDTFDGKKFVAACLMQGRKRAFLERFGVVIDMMALHRTGHKRGKINRARKTR